ncbi:MAG: F420-dependent oxidoreductase [Paenibacillaceae bacterium]|jgi:alkanesulfonate monooxygenase|nr:MAG: F420-dependent oxidoreductase [Paenibacillaceae bacterium]
MSNTTSQSEVELGWFLPTAGDGRYVGVKPEREPTLDYLIRVAQTAEKAGFTFTLIPTSGVCRDAWVVGSAIMAHTKTLSPLVAVRPGLTAPVLTARMAATLDELSGGRARINIVTGSSVQDLVELGDPLAEEHDERYRRTAEFLEVLKSVWTESRGPGVSSEFSGRADGKAGTYFEGSHYTIKGGTCFPKPVQRPHPPIFFGGSSRIGKQTAAAYADVFLMWAEPVHWIREQIAEMEGYLKEYEAQHGVRRTLQYGLRAQVLIRPTEEEAWKAAWDLISKADPKLIEKAREEFAKTDATNQRRQNKLREQSAKNDFVVGPNMWMGLSLLRSGGALLLVGTADQVTDRLLEYVDIGITKFILSGYPHLEEAEIFGREAMPLLKRKLAERNLALANQP